MKYNTKKTHKYEKKKYNMYKMYIKINKYYFSRDLLKSSRDFVYYLRFTTAALS